MIMFKKYRDAVTNQENEAIINRLMKYRVGNDNGKENISSITKDNKGSSNNNDNNFVNKSVQERDNIVGNYECDTQKVHYRKGMRRLRRNIKSGKVDLQDVPFLTQTSNYF